MALKKVEDLAAQMELNLVAQLDLSLVDLKVAS
jgi:hypothetical protein